MKNNEWFNEIDKELKDAFKELKKAYRSLETQTNNLQKILQLDNLLS